MTQTKNTKKVFGKEPEVYITSGSFPALFFVHRGGLVLLLKGGVHFFLNSKNKNEIVFLFLKMKLT